MHRRWVVIELWLVFALSLGASAVRAVVSLVADLAAGVPLGQQDAVLNGSLAPGRPELDLVLQLVYLVAGLVPVALALHLLVRSGEGARTIGFDLRRPATDLGRGVVLAAVVGGTGLAFYLAVQLTGLNLTVVAEDLPAVWWRIPVLVLSAAQNAVLEEVLVGGYLLHRLRQSGGATGGRWPSAPCSVAATTSTRGSAASPATWSWACCSAGSTSGGGGSARSSRHTR